MSAKSTDTRRAAGFLRAAYRAMARIPGVYGILQWTNPLHLPNRLLRQSIAERAHYAGRRLLDIGCGSKPYRDLFPQLEQYVGLDLSLGGGVEVVGNALALPFQAESFDTVMCNQVLEHVPEPSTLLAEVLRVLEPGGHLLLTTPQTWGLHLEPQDYYRYTRYGLGYQSQKAGLEVVSVEPTSGLWATLASRMADTIVHTYGARWPELGVIVMSILLAPALFTGAVLDTWFGKRGDTLDNVMISRKPRRDV